MQKFRAASLSLLFSSALFLSMGCGRLGFELVPVDGGGSTDSGPPLDASMLDGGAFDGSALDGSQSMDDGASAGDGDAAAAAPDAGPVDPGETDVCVNGQCASDVDRCPDTSSDWGGICGCDSTDVDTDQDGTPDCVDDCPDHPDHLADGTCGCAAAMKDSDGDGVENCSDLCANDPDKVLPGICGCNLADTDTDDDGMPDCADPCPSDENKIEAGSCGCGTPETDTDSDGTPDCVDTCNGVDDASYVPITDCGVGYCRATNTPSSCVNGVETPCQPGAPLSDTDTTCDAVDDDCNGAADEDYVVVAQCGSGVCAASSVPSSCSAGVETLCQPGSQLSSTDTTCDGVDDDCSGAADEDYVIDSTCGVGYCQLNNTPSSCVSGVESLCQAAAPLSNDDATADGIDDDCDNSVDEDACTARTDTFAYSATAYTLTPGACTQITVTLWGGGGASGSNDGGNWLNVTGGQGGAGGYAKSTITVSSSSNLQLYVGQGGQGCGAAPGNNASASYRGGAGGVNASQAGSRGEDGSVNGGTGANASSGGDGGRGSFGGAGGGAGASGFSSYGRGGAGGAASALLVDGTLSMLSGGGAGGGGAGTNLIIRNGVSGGDAGAGCSGNGKTGSGAEGGGGGGGGVCQGTTTQAGTGPTPFDPNSELPSGRALGGPNSSDCGKGGDGYAIVTYGP